MTRRATVFLILVFACGCWDTGLYIQPTIQTPTIQPPPGAQPVDALAPLPSCPVIVGNAFTDCDGQPQPERCVAVPSLVPCYSMMFGYPCSNGTDCQTWEVVSNCDLCSCQSCRN
jgi:hypothetical protein